MSKTTKNLAIAIAVLAVLAVAGWVVSTGGKTGNMAVNEQAVKIADRTVDQQAYEFHAGVCDVLDHAIHYTDSMNQAQEAVVGTTPTVTRTIYRDSVSSVAGSAALDLTTLETLEGKAPTVSRVDGEKADYRGALDEMHQAVAGINADMAAKAAAFEPVENGTIEASNEQFSQARSDLMRQQSLVIDAYNIALDKAPIFSRATAEAVRNHPTCRSVFDEARVEDQAVVVQSIVEFAKLHTEAANQVSGAIDGAVQVLADGEGKEPGQIESDYREALLELAAVADQAAASLGAWENQEQDEVLNKAAAPVVPLRDKEAQAYKRLAMWARNTNETVQIVDQDSYSDAATKLQDAQTDVAKAITHTSLRLPLPTEATRDAVQTAQNDAKE